MAGSEVNFGRVTATLQGISFDNRTFPWSRVEAIGFSLPTSGSRYALSTRYSSKAQGALLNLAMKPLQEASRGKQYFDLPIREIHNFFTLQALHKVMTSDSPFSLQAETD
jgi:hypothetical protein